MALLQRISHTGAAVPSALAGAIAPADLTFVISPTTGWPTGAGGRPFAIVVDPNTTIEEKILCATQASGTVTVASGGRGYDNTVPTGHAAGAVVEHCALALELDDDNDHIYTTSRYDHDTQYARRDGTNPFTGAVTLQSGLTVTGPTSLTGTLTETGNATVSGTLGVAGATSLAGLTASGDAAIAGNLTAATVDAGIAGATAPGRFVGSTTAGAPTSGTFAVGDFAVAGNGALVVCTAAGSPGTWAQIGPGYHARYYRVTSWTSTTTTIVFGLNQRQWDTTGAYNTGTAVFTAPFAGYYLVNYQLGWTATAANQIGSVYLRYNGATHAQASSYYSNGAGVVWAQLSDTFQMAAGDTITTLQSSNATINGIPSLYDSYLTIDRLAA
jgi:hypothetical protein